MVLTRLWVPWEDRRRPPGVQSSHDENHRHTSRFVSILVFRSGAGRLTRALLLDGKAVGHTLSIHGPDSRRGIRDKINASAT